MPKDERMRELISLQAIGLYTRSKRYATTLHCRWLKKGWSPHLTPRPAYHSTFGGPVSGFYPAGTATGLNGREIVSSYGIL